MSPVYSAVGKLGKNSARFWARTASICLDTLLGRGKLKQFRAVATRYDKRDFM